MLPDRGARIQSQLKFFVRRGESGRGLVASEPSGTPRLGFVQSRFRLRRTAVQDRSRASRYPFDRLRRRRGILQGGDTSGEPVQVAAQLVNRGLKLGEVIAGAAALSGDDLAQAFYQPRKLFP